MRDGWGRPHPDRLDPAHPATPRILAAHDAAVAAGHPGYLDPESGAFAFTAVALAATGTCCRQGCRHCPWYDPRPLSGG